MPTVELSAGTIEYEDTGGPGPTLVLLHGLLQDSSLWRHVVRQLRDSHRCVVPTWPLGSHRFPMHRDADLTLAGQARLLEEFLDQLDLRDVTLVQNDTAMALKLCGDRPQRVASLGLVACEAFDNYPPGVPGKAAGYACRIPGGVLATMTLLRIRALRRLPMTLGWMSKRPIPHDITDAWFAPGIRDKAIRRDLAKYGGSARRGQMIEVTERLRGFDKPALVVWATEDKTMPRDHGQRLAELLPQGRLVEIDDTYTMIPEDQPAQLADALATFVAEVGAEADVEEKAGSLGDAA